MINSLVFGAHIVPSAFGRSWESTVRRSLKLLIALKTLLRLKPEND
jgi:hypothetical protein